MPGTTNAMSAVNPIVTAMMVTKMGCLSFSHCGSYGFDFDFDPDSVIRFVSVEYFVRLSDSDWEPSSWDFVSEGESDGLCGL